MRNVLITGASRGIGRGCAIAFSKEGDRVFINYNSAKEKAVALAEEIHGIPIKADLANADAVKNMITQIHQTYGKIDVLINNAGIALEQKLITDVTEEEWDRLFSVNNKGMFLVTKAVLPDMVQNHFGKIINLSSMWGISGGSCEVAYSSTKAAVIGFTKALAKEVAPSNIHVNCIAPGVIDTQMNQHLTIEDFEALKEETPLMRIGTVQDVANMAVFLASEKASFITGQIIGVDGGFII